MLRGSVIAKKPQTSIWTSIRYDLRRSLFHLLQGSTPQDTGEELLGGSPPEAACPRASPRVVPERWACWWCRCRSSHLFPLQNKVLLAKPAQRQLALLSHHGMGQTRRPSTRLSVQRGKLKFTEAERKQSTLMAQEVTLVAKCW